MPVRLIDSTDKPTYISKPDIRFATTFLSHEYRDYSVDGETMMDKMTGEIFIKRPIDGRVLSYEQNKKYVHDLVLELRILLTNNEEFTYPKNSIDAFYLSTNYDLVTINKEILKDILKSENTEIPVMNDNIDLRNTLSFSISNQCNGFFCRPTTRDSDKMAVQILSNLYNSIVQNYDGTDTSIKNEQKKFITIEKWKDSDAILTYTIEITSMGSTQKYELTDYIRLNEEMCILFPVDVLSKYPDGYDSVKVTINKLDYYKMHFVMNLPKDITGVDNSMDLINDYLCPDGKIYVNYINIVSFVDSYRDIKLLGNETTIGFLDIPYLRRYMMKMSKLKRASEFIQSTYRPSDDDWGANAVWAELIRDVRHNGEIIDRNSETDLKELETYISKNNLDIVNINPDITEETDIWIDDITPENDERGNEDANS